jgi:GYF domain 2
MDWYYAKGEARTGPVGDQEFQRLVKQGVVTPETLVWRDGMPGWEAFGAGMPSAVPVTSTLGAAACALCGRSVPASEIFSLAGAQYCAACKPEILQRISVGQPIATQGAEEMRNTYIKHEASVKSIGVLYYLGAIAVFMAGIVAVIPGATKVTGPEAVFLAVFFLFLSAAQILVGTGLRRLRKWAKIPTGILAGVGLLGFPLGTLINGYILYLVFSKKGAMVFSDEYQAAIAQTPHIKYRTSKLIWILLGLVMLIIALVIIGITAGRG